MSVKRFRLEGVVYEIGTQADVKLRDFMLLEQETAELGRVFTMGDIVRLAETWQTLSEEESRHHPEAAWMLAATIWIAMIRKARQSGNTRQVLFADAIDADLSTFEQLADPQDRAPGKPKAAKKKAAKASKRPTPARSRSSVVGAGEAVAEAEPTPT